MQSGVLKFLKNILILIVSIESLVLSTYCTLYSNQVISVSLLASNMFYTKICIDLKIEFDGS